MFIWAKEQGSRQARNQGGPGRARPPAKHQGPPLILKENIFFGLLREKVPPPRYEVVPPHQLLPGYGPARVVITNSRLTELGFYNQSTFN